MSYENRITANPQAVQKLLDENAQLIQAILDYQNKGKAVECVQYQQLLHKNLVYLANLADSSHNIQAMIPPPPQGQVQAGSAMSPMSIPGGPHPVNQQERKMMVPNALEQNSAAMSNMMRQTMSPQMPGGMPSSATMTSSGNMVSDTGPFAPSSAGVPSMKTSNTPPVARYPGNPNQMIATGMVPTSQGILPGQQGYMPAMHPGQQIQQQHTSSQQYIMQQTVPMGYNTGSVQQIHPSQQQMGQQPYLSNQNVGTSQPPGMVGYQQPPPPTYDPYNQVPEYNNPYGQQ